MNTKYGDAPDYFLYDYVDVDPENLPGKCGDEPPETTTTTTAPEETTTTTTATTTTEPTVGPAGTTVPEETTTTTAAPPPPTEQTAAPIPEALPRTGAGTNALVAIGLGLFLSGLGMVAVDRMWLNRAT